MDILKFDLSGDGNKFKILNATNGGPWHKRHANDQFRSNFSDYKAARIPYSRNHDSGVCGNYGGPYSHDITCIFPNFDADPYDPASYDFACTDESVLVCLDAGTETFFRLGQTIEHQKKTLYPSTEGFQKVVDYLRAYGYNIYFNIHNGVIMNKIIEITDYLAPELDVYARLTEVQLLNREFPEKGLFIAESPKVIERALDAGYEPVSCLMEKRHIEGEGKQILAGIKDVPVFCAEFDILTQLTGFKLTRGMLCAMKRKPLPDVRKICENKRRIVILDKVMNPTNVGAIIRSAAALGMDAVILTPGCSDPLYRRAARVSMGTVFQIEWTFMADDSLDEIKALGFKTVAMALKDNSLSVNDPVLTDEKKLAVIMGTEGDGLSDQTISECDFTVKIPMYHGVDSLNVAAASAVAFYQLGNKQNGV